MANVKTRIDNHIAKNKEELLKGDYAYPRMTGQFTQDLTWLATLIDIYGNEELKQAIAGYFPE